MFPYDLEGVEDRAWFIMASEGSVARIRVKEDESSRDIRPCPHPRSSRREEGGAWYASTVLKRAGG